MKKTTYTTKTPAELATEIATLRASLHAMTVKGASGKIGKAYSETRKNIARALTAQNQARSTNA
jgi:ribosomal protein L29